MLTEKEYDASVQRNARVVIPRAMRLVTPIHEKVANRLAYYRTHPLERLEILDQIGNAVLDAIGNNSACRVGCSHCCKIAVTVDMDEALRLAEFSGKKITEPKYNLTDNPEMVHLQRKAFMGHACPFLDGGVCSVYPVRPMACRLHHNLGNDPERCDTKNDNTVASLGMDKYYELAVFTSPIGLIFNDIREFFPDENSWVGPVAGV